MDGGVEEHVLMHSVVMMLVMMVMLMLMVHDGEKTCIAAKEDVVAVAAKEVNASC